MTEEQEDNDKGGITRRDLLGPGAMGAGLLAYTAAASEKAAAQVGSEPLIQLGDKYEFDEDANGNLIIRHVDNGEVLKYDQTADQITDVKPFQSIATDDLTVNNLSAHLEKTSNQAISATTDTTVDWDNQEIDTDLYSYNTTNDEIDVLAAGDYIVSASVRWINLSDQDQIGTKLFLNGALQRETTTAASGTSDQAVWILAVLRNLSVNDTIRIDVRSNDANSLLGNAANTYADITRSG